MAIPRDVLVGLALMSDLEFEQAEAIVDMLLEVESATQAEVGNSEEQIDQRRAGDRERQRRYRERAKSADTKWLGKRHLVFERDGYKCTYCGADVTDDPNCDHVLPLIAGGTNDLINLTTSCRRCNSAKAGRTLQEWGGPSWGSSQQQ